MAALYLYGNWDLITKYSVVLVYRSDHLLLAVIIEEIFIMSCNNEKREYLMKTMRNDKLATLPIIVVLVLCSVYFFLFIHQYI